MQTLSRLSARLATTERSCIDGRLRNLYNYQHSDPNHRGAGDSAGSDDSSLELPVPVEHMRLYLWGDSLAAYQRSYGVSSAYKATPGVQLTPVLRALNVHICHPCVLPLNMASGKQ